MSRRLRWSELAGPFAAGVAIVVLAAWALRVPGLTTIASGWPSMKPNTAVGFVLCGVALFGIQHGMWRDHSRWRRVGIGLAAVAACLGALTVLEYRAHVDLGLDRLFMRHALAPGESGPPGRMSEATAWGFVLLGSALVLLAVPVAVGVAQGLCSAVLLLATVPALGYAYDDPSIRAIEPFASVAVQTAVLFLILSAATLHVRPDEGPMRTATGASLGGRTIRRLLPIFVIAVFGGGLVRSWGMRAGFYSPGKGEPVIVAAVMAMLTVALWYNAVQLTRVEVERDQFFTLGRDLFCILEYDGTLARVNQAFTRSLGWSDDDLARHPLIDFVHPGDRDAVTRELAALRGGAAAPGLECRVRNSAGDWRRVSWTAAPGPHGRLIYVVGRDVTELRASEQALRESRQNLAITLRSIGDGVIVTDAAGRVTGLNPAGERLTGWRESDARGRLVGDVFRIVQADTRRPVAVPVDRVLSTGEDADLADHTILIARDGVEHPIGDSAAPIRDDAGQLVGVVMVFRDVTTERTVEQGLRDSNAELQAQFLQSQKMESIGRLAGSVAHDFNNLLTVINSLSALALESTSPTDPLVPDLKTIRDAGGRAAELTKQLLAFSRRQVMEPQVVDLNATVEHLTPILARLVGADVELVVRRAADLWTVTVDPGQLAQVIMNLVVNAGDAMPDGGVLTFETRNVALDEAHVTNRTDLARGDFVMFVVSDTGLGMDADTMRRVFEPFFTTKEVGKGTGLGLSTVYGIVRQSGGDVVVESEVGGGTTFRIYLPRTVGGDEPRAARPEGRRPGGGETVLIVEDQAALRLLSERILVRAGYAVLTAPSGAEALETLAQRAGHIDLLLTDLMMPGMTGAELAKRVAEAHPHVRVLYTSGYTDETVIGRGAEGRGHFIAKPFSVGELTRKVRDVLDQ